MGFPIVSEHIMYGLAWASFGGVHSVLAADSLRSRLGFGRYDRLPYNGLAILHLAAIWLLGQIWLGSAPPLGVLPVIATIGDGMVLVGLGVIAVALTGYDRGRFLGTSQIRMPETAPDEELKIGG